MELDPEQRRREREEYARKRAARSRRIRILLIAAAVLVAAGLTVGIVLLAGSHGGGEAHTEATEETEAPSDVIHLAFAGDLNVTENVLAAGNYDDVFRDVAPILAQADLAALNLEGSASAVPAAFLESLSRAGVDVLQLANSYAISDGILGLSNAVDAVNSAGMTPLGVYKNESDFRRGRGYVIREAGGIRVAFTAFTKGMDGMTLPAGSENCVNLLYRDYDSTYQTVDKERIASVMNAVAEERPDLTVVMLHWGSEYNDTVSKTQDAIRELLYGKGADVIIGTHAHYVQKIEQEDGKLTAYCLGDFFGDAPRSGSDYSVILDLEVTKTAEGVTSVTDSTYTPIYTVKQEDKPVAVMRIRETMAAFQGGYISRVSQETYDSMANALERIEARIHPEKKETK